MRGRTILAIILGAVLFAGAANAGGNRVARAHENGCRKNVNAKIKAGTVKKADFQAEYGKCVEDPNYQ